MKGMEQECKQKVKTDILVTLNHIPEVTNQNNKSKELINSNEKLLNYKTPSERELLNTSINLSDTEIKSSNQIKNKTEIGETSSNMKTELVINMNESMGIYIETPVMDESTCSKDHFIENLTVQPKSLTNDLEFLDEDENEIISTVETDENIKLSKEKIQNIENNSEQLNMAAVSLFEEDTTSSCGNIININMEQDNVIKSVSGSTLKTTQCQSKKSNTNALINNSVQCIDVIERKDFEDEQKLTGKLIMNTNSLLNSDNRLNLEPMEKLNNTNDNISEKGLILNKEKSKSTPLSRFNEKEKKQTAKFNLSIPIEKPSSSTKESTGRSNNPDTLCNKDENVSEKKPSMASQGLRICKQYDMFVNTNSSDSLSSDRSFNTPSDNLIPNLFEKKCTDDLNNIKEEIKICKKTKLKTDNISESPLTQNTSVQFSEPTPSTSTSPFKCQFVSLCCDSQKSKPEAENNYNKILNEVVSNKSSENAKCSKSKLETIVIEEKKTDNVEFTVFPKIRNNHRYDDHILEGTQLCLQMDLNENDFDDDNWADCDDGSDEEACICYNDCLNSTIDDELPSRDVDLSGFVQLASISDEMFLEENSPTETPLLSRKRKINESRVFNLDNIFTDSQPAGRKRIALESISTPRSSSLSNSSGLCMPSTSLERRTSRSVIPTKDNPPPELQNWLLQFQRWSHAERILAVDRLIEHCEPTQVRHMMKVIEPQFQRDFISLLPKELALQVLSYLEPKDLLRAAQTCRSWRFLCDDNLLWKEKCKRAQIALNAKTGTPKRGRAGNMPPISSLWKAAYMRQQVIEMNWRSRPIRQPKVLKGHDDHVITCLQFFGNRIVSGSDDNTLKVWSAVTGKCLRTLVGHTGGVWSSQMSGNIIISGSTDRTLKVWDIETGRCIHTLLGHTSTVRCMHLHGNKVVSGSRDATLRVWDIEQGTCLHVLVGHLAAVRCVQYDGKLIVSGAYDYMVKIWNPERQECLHTLQGHTNRVYSLQFDGIHVVSGSLDTSIRVWDAETGSCKHTLMGHQSLTSGMELRHNILVSGNADSTVKVWDITTGQCLQTLSGPHKHQSAVTCLQFNSKFVITSSDDGTVKLWDVKTGEFIRNLVALDSGGSGGVVWRIRANDTKLICAVGSRNGTEETKLMVLDFDVEGACPSCS